MTAGKIFREDRLWAGEADGLIFIGTSGRVHDIVEENRFRARNP